MAHTSARPCRVFSEPSFVAATAAAIVSSLSGDKQEGQRLLKRALAIFAMHAGHTSAAQQGMGAPPGSTQRVHGSAGGAGGGRSPPAAPPPGAAGGGSGPPAAPPAAAMAGAAAARESGRRYR